MNQNNINGRIRIVQQQYTLTENDGKDGGTKDPTVVEENNIIECSSGFNRGTSTTIGNPDGTYDITLRSENNTIIIKNVDNNMEENIKWNN